jgi:hypothetical protein
MKLFDVEPGMKVQYCPLPDEWKGTKAPWYPAVVTNIEYGKTGEPKVHLVVFTDAGVFVKKDVKQELPGVLVSGRFCVSEEQHLLESFVDYVGLNYRLFR